MIFKRTYCPDCNRQCRYKVVESQGNVLAVYGLKTTYTKRTAYCRKCGREVYVGKIGEWNYEQQVYAYAIAKMLREMHGEENK